MKRLDMSDFDLPSPIIEKPQPKRAQLLRSLLDQSVGSNVPNRTQEQHQGPNSFLSPSSASSFSAPHYGAARDVPLAVPSFIDSSLSSSSSFLNSQNSRSLGRNNKAEPLPVIDSASQFSHVVDYLRRDKQRRLNGDVLLRPEEPACAQVLRACDESFARARLFAQICDKRASELQPSVSAGMAAAQVEVLSERADAMRAERNTWLLLELLYSDRQATAVRRSDAAQAGRDFIVRARSASRRDVLEAAVANDDTLRELSLVVRWLEQTDEEARRNAAPIQSSWHETARALTQRRINGERESELFELDVDAPLRAARGTHLTTGDAGDERRLLAEIWRLVRGGRLLQARQLCRDADQPWRAAVLAGGELSSDERRNGLAGNAQGNFTRAAWKAACWAVARCEVAPMHERATMGALCGSLNAMLLCCHTYDDYLWAHLRAALERRADDALAASADAESAAERVDLSAQQYAQVRDQDAAPPLLTRDVLALLSRSSIAAVRQGSSERFRRLQALIMLDDVAGLLAQLAKWVGDGGEAADSAHMLRFAAHAVLFFNANGLTSDAENVGACCTVLRAYIAHLKRERNTPLVAQYTALLPDTHERVASYVAYMSHVDDDAQRQVCLREAEKAGLDVATATRNVVEHVAASQPSSEVGAPSDKSADALRWLCFDPLQRTEAVCQANALMRDLICRGKLEQCERIVERVLPANSLELVADAARADPAVAWWHDRVAREHRSLCAYVSAMRAFELWLEHFSRQPAPAPIGDMPSATALYSDQVMYRRSAERAETERQAWQARADSLLDTAQQQALAVLTMPKGFLIDIHSGVNRPPTAQVESERDESLNRVRRHALPTLLLALSRALLAAGRTRNVTSLACILADDELQLMRWFSDKDAAQFLETCRRAAIANVASGRDTLGFAIVD